MYYTKASLLLLAVLTVISCAPVSQKSTFQKAAPGGFVPEVDEAATRGRLSRVTTPDMFVFWRFRVSPDGRYVVFSGKQAGSDEPYQLYKLEVGGGAPVKLTTGGDTDAWDPSFTADGKYIVYRTEQIIWKISADGSGAKMKVPGSGLGSDYYPQVSPKGRLAFVTYDSTNIKYLIWTSGLDGSDLTQYREGNFPSWSPDGTRIVFEYQNDIWMMGSDGKELTQMTSTKEIQEHVPSFSPKGDQIVYASNEGKGNVQASDFNIWTMNLDATAKTQVTDLKSWDSWPVWADDGIYFLSGRGKSETGIQRIWRVKY